MGWDLVNIGGWEVGRMGGMAGMLLWEGCVDGRMRGGGLTPKRCPYIEPHGGAPVRYSAPLDSQILVKGDGNIGWTMDNSYLCVIGLRVNLLKIDAFLMGDKQKTKQQYFVANCY